MYHSKETCATQMRYAKETCIIQERHESFKRDMNHSKETYKESIHKRHASLKQQHETRTLKKSSYKESSKRDLKRVIKKRRRDAYPYEGSLKRDL